MSTTTRSQRFCADPSQPSAPASSSAVPTTSIGAISSRAATRFSRITGLSSTMNAFSWVMGRHAPEGEGCASTEVADELAVAASEGRMGARFSYTECAECRAWHAGQQTKKRPSSVGELLRRGGFWLALVVRARCRGTLARAAEPQPLVVGSKRFTESYMLAEIITQTLAAAGVPATHKAGPRQHRHPRAGARQRRGRPVPGVHRHHRSRAAEARRQSLARRAERAGSLRAT